MDVDLHLVVFLGSRALLNEQCDFCGVQLCSLNIQGCERIVQGGVMPTQTGFVVSPQDTVGGGDELCVLQYSDFTVQTRTCLHVHCTGGVILVGLNNTLLHAHPERVWYIFEYFLVIFSQLLQMCSHANSPKHPLVYIHTNVWRYAI